MKDILIELGFCITGALIASHTWKVNGERWPMDNFTNVRLAPYITHIVEYGCLWYEKPNHTTILLQYPIRQSELRLLVIESKGPIVFSTLYAMD